MPSAPAAVSWRTLVWLALALGVLTLLTYSNSFTAGLTLDNKGVLMVDPRIRAWNAQNLALIFKENYWWPYAATNLYRPLTTLTYLFNYAILGNGLQVAGYHWINFLLHWANVWLVLVVLHRLTRRLDVAALAAALFAVHPVNVESVTNIVGRADLLATFTLLFGGWCHLRAAAVAGWRKLPWLAGLGLITCVGVLMKESAVMVIAFVGLYDWLWRWPRLPGATWRERLPAAFREFFLRGWIVLLPGAVLLLWAHYRVLATSPVYGDPFVDNPIAYASVVPRVMTAVKVVGCYLGLLVMPATLSCDYSYNQIPLFGESVYWWQDLYAWIALAVVAALLWAALHWRHRRPAFAWGVLFLFVMLLPTSNLLVTIGSIMAERFLYLPSIGFCLVAALALRPWGEQVAQHLVPDPAWRPRAAWALPALAVAALALRAHVRNADWHDDLSLWKSAVAAAPDSFKTHKGYANAIWDAGRNEAAIDAAIARAEISLAILDQKPLAEDRRDDTLFFDLGMYYRLKGDFLDKRSQPAEAKRFYLKSVAILRRAEAVDRWVDRAAQRAELRRGRPAADLTDVGNFRIYLQLGQSYLRLGQWAEAEAAGRYLLRLSPGTADGYTLVSAALFSVGRYDDAAVQTLASLILNPRSVTGWGNLVKCYQAMGLVPAPIAVQGENYALNDSNPIARRQLVTACATLVHNCEVAHLTEQAAALRELASARYHVPPEALAAVRP